METATSNTTPPQEGFVDRRQPQADSSRFERRQFSSSHDDLSSDARELALAIDSYKLQHRRRYITFEEMLTVVQQLGYSK